jgi:hypothetical protein
MARSYLLFRPARLPLEAADLSATTVLDLADSPALRADLERALPGLMWRSAYEGSATVAGNWYEVRIPHGETTTVSLRCSLRVDHSKLIQELCDRLGWLAFDETPLCFQPHRGPIRA